jgi:hypothetical protein
MAKAAATICDVIAILLLTILGLHEILTFQLEVSRSLPNVGELLGYDAFKLFLISVCAYGIWHFMKRIRTRLKSG